MTRFGGKKTHKKIADNMNEAGLRPTKIPDNLNESKFAKKRVVQVGPPSEGGGAPPTLNGGRVVGRRGTPKKTCPLLGENVTKKKSPAFGRQKSPII